MIRIVEKYYAVRELAFLLGFSETYIRIRIKSGEFSPSGNPMENIVEVGSDIRVPASGVVFWLQKHPLKSAAGMGVAARSPGELRRKLTTEGAE